MREKRQYQNLSVKLHWQHRRQLQQLVSRGEGSARAIRRANILLAVDRGLAAVDVSKMLSCTARTVRNVAEKYREEGLERALTDNPRPGKEPALTESQSQRIVAIACGPPPEGYDRWSVRLLTEEVNNRKIARVSREPIRKLLKSHDLKPWREKNVVRS